MGGRMGAVGEGGREAGELVEGKGGGGVGQRVCRLCPRFRICPRPRPAQPLPTTTEAEACSG